MARPHPAARRGGVRRFHQVLNLVKSLDFRYPRDSRQSNLLHDVSAVRNSSAGISPSSGRRAWISHCLALVYSLAWAAPERVRACYRGRLSPIHACQLPTLARYPWLAAFCRRDNRRKRRANKAPNRRWQHARAPRAAHIELHTAENTCKPYYATGRGMRATTHKPKRRKRTGTHHARRKANQAVIAIGNNAKNISVFARNSKSSKA